MSDTKEGYTDFLRRVADDHEHYGNHATAKDYRESARRIDNLVNKLYHITGLFAGLHENRNDWGDYKAAMEELERYGR